MRKYAPVGVSSVQVAPVAERGPRKVEAVAKTSEAGTPELQAISEQLLTAARKLGLSQNQVAKLSGVSRKHVGVALSGGNISLSVLLKLLRALKVDSLDLGDVSLRAERKSVNPHLVEHARTLLDRAIADARDAAELLREGNLGEHASRVVRQVVREARGPAKAGSRAGRRRG